MASREDTIGGLFGLVVMLPSFGSVIIGGLTIVWQCSRWLEKAVWPELTLRTALSWWTERTIYDRDLATGYLGLDKLVLWSMDQLPLALWLIVIVPIVWIVTWFVIFNWFIGQSSDHRTNAG